MYSEVTKTLSQKQRTPDSGVLCFCEKAINSIRHTIKPTLVIRTKLAAAVLGGGRGGSEEMICRPSTATVGGKGRFWCAAFY